MSMSYPEAVKIQRRHESDLMALPGVVGVSVVLADNVIVLKISVAPDAELPAELVGVSELDGLPVSVVRERYELQ
jgi:hypothetical protein